jgi:RNA polymerase sigma factor (sigma-70 family)
MVLAARPVVGSTDEARDCASEAIVQYLERRPEDIGNLEAFMVTIAKRRAIDHERARRRARLRDERFANEHALTAPDVAEDIAARAEAFWADEQASRLLSPHVYELLRLVADGVPFPEVARRLDMSERAVQSHLHRARRLVRAALAKTLAALGLGTASLRKWAGTPATAAPALAAAFVVAVQVLGGSPAPAAPALALMPSTTIVDGTGFATASMTSRSASGQNGVRLAATSMGHRTPTAAPRIVGVQTHVVGVDLEKHDDGYHSSGPVEQIQHCLQNLRIEVHYQGCEQPSADQGAGQPAGDGQALPAVG